MRALVSSLISLATPDKFASVPPTHTEAYAPPRRGIRPRADVYLPQTPGPHPSVVLVHGGGFAIGSRAMKPMRYLAAHLLARGVAVMSFDYRMVLRGGALDTQVDDVRAAVSWWADRASTYHLDPTAIHAAGLSAGATLLLLASAPNPPIPLRRLVSVFGLYDFADLARGPRRLLGRAVLGSWRASSWSERSVNHTELTQTPVTFLHGTADGLTPYHRVTTLHQRRLDAGLDSTLVTYPDAPHAFFNDALSPLAQQATRDFVEALQLDPAPAV